MLPLTCIAFLIYVTAIFASPTLNHIGRIVGGEDIPIEKAPYQVVVEINGELQCGGCIIAPNYILTAAHCFRYVQESDKLTIRAGTATRDNGGQVINVKQYTDYPDYDGANDITVIELAENLEYNEKVAPINLPDPNESWPVGTEALVTGWGWEIMNSPSSPVNLQGLVIKLVDENDCGEGLKYICAAVDGGGKSPCFFDDGGPLQVDGTLVGLVHGGVCGSELYPTNYANVAMFRGFITDVTGI